MMSVLFMIGRGDESDQIIDDLFDVDSVQIRPEYEMAPGENLILSDCGFEDLNWNSGVFVCHETFSIQKVSSLRNKFFRKNSKI